MMTHTFSPVIDFDMLLGRLDNDRDFLKEILNDFVRDVYEKITDLKIGLQEKNFAGIQMISHTLKGTTSYLTAYFLNEAVCKMEQAAKKMDFKMVFTYFKIFENEFDKLITFLNRDQNHWFISVEEKC